VSAGRGCAEHRHDRLSSVRSAIGEDVLRFATFHPDYHPEMSARKRLSILLQPSILCLVSYRLSHYLWVRGWRTLADVLARLNLLVFKAHIPAESCIGPGCFLGHTVATTFMGSAGRDLTLFSLAICCPDETGLGSVARSGPRLGNSVTVSAHAMVIGPVSVGDRVVLAPGVWLDHDCASDSLGYSARLRPITRSSRRDDSAQSSSAR
jgi:serine O-acetyltransferase